MREKHPFSETSPEAARPRFLADVMVGKLARWLRVLGVDVAYDPSLDDDDLLLRARRESRILLTRDAPLAARGDAARTLFIESGDFREQLRQVVGRYDLDPWGGRFTRCVDCNAALEEVAPEAVRERVPPYVYATQNRFKRCPGCEKILWGGTHREHMEKLLARIFSS